MKSYWSGTVNTDRFGWTENFGLFWVENACSNENCQDLVKCQMKDSLHTMKSEIDIPWERYKQRLTSLQTQQLHLLGIFS